MCFFFSFPSIFRGTPFQQLGAVVQGFSTLSSEQERNERAIEEDVDRLAAIVTEWMGIPAEGIIVRR